MTDEEDRDRPDTNDEPFRKSGSGEDYDPNGNWGAERRTPGATRGDGGFRPEGDYAGAAEEPDADALGQLNEDPERLIDEASETHRQRRRDRRG